MQIEKRTFTGELRAEQSGNKTFLIGRAASFGIMSRDLGGWKEVIQKGAFDDVLRASDLDCIATLNHNPSHILGRTRSKTLNLTVDAKGMNYKVLLPGTTIGEDVAELCARKDLTESSFAFTVSQAGQTWDEAAEDPETGERCVLRTITKIQSLFDVAVVSAAAYPQTSAGLSDRGLPQSMPIEVRNRIMARAAEDEQDCACDCAFCRGGACDECDNEDCTDLDCAGCPQQADSRGNRGRRSGDPAAALVQAATDYFSSDAADADKAGVWSQLEQLATKAGIDTDDEGERSARDRSVALAMAQW
jgi:HK97 family phage prohead protease